MEYMNKYGPKITKKIHMVMDEYGEGTLNKKEKLAEKSLNNNIQLL